MTILLANWQTICQRLFLIAVLQCAILGQVLAQQQSDLRQVRWGFSPKEVREAESTKPTSAKKEKLIYTGIPLLERTVGLEYEFNGDSLLSASYYYYTTASISQADVSAAFSEWEAQLTEKYGRGKKAKVGELQTVTWITPRTQIRLALGNIDRGWSVELGYLCRVCSGDPQNDRVINKTWKPLKEVKDF